MSHAKNFRVFVDRLAQEANESDVQILFSKAGFEPEFIKLPTYPGVEGKHKGYAFVTLKSEDEGLRAIKYLNNAKIYGKHIQLEPAKVSMKADQDVSYRRERHDSVTVDAHGALVPADEIPQGLVQVRFANGDNMLVPYCGKIIDLKIKIAPMVDMFYPQISITSDDGKQCMDDSYHIPRTRKVMCVLHGPAGDGGIVEFKRTDWIAIIKQYAYAFDDFTVWKGCQMACDPRYVEDCAYAEFFKWQPRELLIDFIMDEIRSDGTPEVVNCYLLAGRRRGNDGVELSLIDSKDRFGATAIMKAVIYRRIEIARFLTQKWQADVNVTDDSHTTPIRKATELNDTDMIQLLIRYGADQMVPVRTYDATDDEHEKNIDAVAEMLEHVHNTPTQRDAQREDPDIPRVSSVTPCKRERKHKRGKRDATEAKPRTSDVKEEPELKEGGPEDADAVTFAESAPKRRKQEKQG